jgi:hypothetical protein
MDPHLTKKVAPDPLRRNYKASNILLPGYETTHGLELGYGFGGVMQGGWVSFKMIFSEKNKN